VEVVKRRNSGGSRRGSSGERGRMEEGGVEVVGGGRCGSSGGRGRMEEGVVEVKEEEG
jgi:hypothetical protein